MSRYLPGGTGAAMSMNFPDPNPAYDSASGLPAEQSGLFCDLYELTMAQTFFCRNMFGPATFSLFVRNYPPNRGYLVSAGLGASPGIPRKAPVRPRRTGLPGLHRHVPAGLPGLLGRPPVHRKRPRHSGGPAVFRRRAGTGNQRADHRSTTGGNFRD